MSRYAAADDYVYPGTTVLRSKADLQEQVALDAFEADATAVRMLALLEQPFEGVVVGHHGDHWRGGVGRWGRRG